MIVSFVEMYCIDMSLHTHTASYSLSLAHAIWCWWCMRIASCPPGRYSLLLSRTAQCRVCVFSRPPKAVANNLHYRKLHIQFIKYDSSQLFFLNLRKYCMCIIGWINFSELEITVCGSSKMSTKKLNCPFFIFFYFFVLRKSLIIFPPPYIVKKTTFSPMFENCFKLIWGWGIQKWP